MVSRDFRIRTDRDIKRVLKLGRKFNAPECSLYTLPNTLQHARIAVVVASGVSKKAIVRNRLKRQMRDVLRIAIQQKQFNYTIDIVIMIRPPATRIPDGERREFYRNFLQRARLLP